MDYPSNDPLSGLYWIAAEIQRAVTPAPLTIAALLDPFNMAAGASSTSSTTDSSVEAYAMQLRVVQGVLFGMAVLVLAGSIIFAIGRIAFNSCGGLESTKESGYRAATMWTTRVFFYVFGFVLLYVVQ